MIHRIEGREAIAWNKPRTRPAETVPTQGEFKQTRGLPTTLQIHPILQPLAYHQGFFMPFIPTDHALDS
jgi:hypothetical protein